MKEHPLREIIKDFPKEPGVYQFFNVAGEVLYIGKAKSLHNRIKSYFANDIGRGPGIDLMVQQAADVRYYVTESEIEAVILEADLINTLKPKYNIRQKDDKSFLAIKITKEEFPKVGLVRFRDVDLGDKSAEYFGPYPSGDLLKKSMRYLRRIFPFRDCTDRKYGQYSSLSRTCLYGDIGVCEGVCANSEKKAAYRKDIQNFKMFLRGKKDQVAKDLEKEMIRLSKNQQFEAAGIIRDRLRALQHLKDVGIGLRDDVLSPSALLFKRIECYDISNISGQYAVGSMVVFTNGVPDKDEYRKFKIKYQKSNIKMIDQKEKKGVISSHPEPTLRVDSREARNPAANAVMGSSRQPMNRLPQDDTWATGDRGTGDIQMMQEVLERRLRNDWPLPDLMIIDGGATHVTLARRILDHKSLNIPVIGIAKGPKRDKNEFHFSNAAIAQYFHANKDLSVVAIKARNEAHRFAREYYRKLHGKAMLE